ncbi:hypothetical protein FBULB1_10312 [Fusarium bulbicola]|nr:hypothetical protein FBULB1_10312 [Fusarium bulbicola]
MATTFPNIYTLRKVADTAAKACDICYKSSTSVLITPDQKDFFFVCPVHLKDRYFCTPKIDEEAAKRKREKELEEEKERVKKEYEEKKKKKKEKEEKKEEDKDKKEKDGDKEKDKEEKDEKKDEDKDKEDKTPPAEEEPRVFELKAIYLIFIPVDTMSIIFGEAQCDGCQTLIAADPDQRAVQFYCNVYPAGIWMYVFLRYPSHANDSPKITCLFLHMGCFRTILFTPEGRKRPQDEIDCFRRAMAWRRTDLMPLFRPEMDVPGPRRVKQRAIKSAALGLNLQPLDRLKMEIVHMIQSYCPDAYFWELVQLLNLRDLACPGKDLSKYKLSRVMRWTRGDPSPGHGHCLADPEYLRISLDSEGICEILRVEYHPHPPNDDPSKRYVLVKRKDIESVTAYF